MARQVERQVAERALEANARRHVDVEDELLDRLLDLLVVQVVVANERGTVRVETTPRLGAGAFALGREGRVDDLPEEAAKVLGRLRLALARDAAEPVDQELAEVPARAVRTEETEVVNVGRPRLVGLPYAVRVDLVEPVLLREKLTDVVVQPIDRFLGIGVFLRLPVAIFEIVAEHLDGRTDQGVHLAGALALLAIEDKRLGRPGVAVFDEDLLDKILQGLDFRRRLPYFSAAASSTSRQMASAFS